MDSSRAEALPIGLTTSLLPKFPDTFSLFNKGSGLSRSHVLGEQQDQSLFLVSHHRVYSRKPDVVLHSGVGDDDPPLATVKFHSLSQKFSVSLHVGGSAGVPEEIHIEYEPGFPHGSYSFTEPGRYGKDAVWEWKHARGTELRGLGGDHEGWVLGRRENDVLGEVTTSKASKETTDGEGVFAWASDQASRNRAAVFSFVGAGKSGAMDERMRLIAIISSLGLFERYRRENRMSVGQVPGGARIPGILGNFGV